MILRKLQFMKEASCRNPEKPKMQESVASGKSISRTGLPAAGLVLRTAHHESTGFNVIKGHADGVGKISSNSAGIADMTLLGPR